MTTNTSSAFTSFEPLKVYPNRIKLFGYFLFALLTLYVLLFTEINVSEVGDKGTGTRLSVFLEILETYDLDFPVRAGFLLLGITLFGYMLIYIPFVVIRNRPIIIATEEGLIADGLLKRNLVPWNKIDKFRIVKSKFLKTVEIVTVEGYQTPKNHSWLRKLFGVARDRHQINPTFASTSSDELIVELTERLESAKGISTSSHQLRMRTLISGSGSNLLFNFKILC